MADEKSVMVVIRAARPTFRNEYDKVVFAVHGAFLADGYILTATGPSAFADDALSSSSTDEVGIEGWNDLEEDYAFVYANPEKGGKRVLVKCLVMNDKLMVDALANGDSQPLHLELDVGEYIGENGGGNYAEQYKNLDKLVKKMNEEILSKLNGSDSKSSVASSSTLSMERSDGSRHVIDEPSVEFTEPVGPQIPPSGFVIPPVSPFGGSDVFPGPPPGAYPSGGPFGGGGSMLIGPDDPRWFGGQPGFPGGQPGIPPGARFDPYGPPDVLGFDPSRFIRRPRRPGRGIHPELQQPGNDSDFI